MTSWPFLPPCRSRARYGLLALGLWLMCPGQPGNAEERVEVRPVRYTVTDGATGPDLAALLAPEAREPRRQPTNINRRLVTYGPDLPLAERRAIQAATEAAHWYAFAESHLEDGDVLYRLGRARTHLFMNFSRVTAHATRSRYSHSAIFRWRDGVPEVIDITSTGIRVQAFPVWMREVDGNVFGAARLRPEHRDRIPAVLAYLDGQSEARPQFDYVFEPDNGRFYCNELTEMAFRSAGLPLSEPVPSNQLPGFRDMPIWTWLVKVIGKVNMDTPVFVVGNQDYGIFASSKLQVIYATGEGEPATPADAVVVAALPRRP